MAHAIGCLGTGAVTVCRAERAKRKNVAPLIPRRNQNRTMTWAVIEREGTTRVKVIPVRQGHLHHVKSAFMWGEVKYAGDLK